MFGGRENILLCSHKIRPDLDRGGLWVVRGSRLRGRKRLFFFNVFTFLCVHVCYVYIQNQRLMLGIFLNCSLLKFLR